MTTSATWPEYITVFKLSSGNAAFYILCFGHSQNLVVINEMDSVPIARVLFVHSKCVHIPDCNYPSLVHYEGQHKKTFDYKES